MPLAYLIVAHRNLPQLRRLIARLACDGAVFFVNLDAKVEDAAVRAFARSVEGLPVRMVGERIDIRWGTFSIVDAVLRGLRAAVASGEAFTRLHLLSGQCYPLVDNAQLMAHAAAAGDAEFISWRDLREDWREAAGRYERYHFERALGAGLAGDAARLLGAAASLLLPARRPPAGLTVYGGSAWWSLTRGAVEYVLRYSDGNPQVLRFFRGTQIADEMYFQTILLNSPLRERLRNDNLRYIDWSARGRHPKVLGAADLPALAASGKLFARKFDDAVDAAVMDRLDQRAGGTATLRAGGG